MRLNDFNVDSLNWLPAVLVAEAVVNYSPHRTDIWLIVNNYIWNKLFHQKNVILQTFILKLSLREKLFMLLYT